MTLPTKIFFLKKNRSYRRYSFFQIAAVEAALDRLSGLRQELEELWATRKLRLELCLRLRVFERDALEASGQLEMWAQEMQSPPREGTPEQLLRAHNDGVVHMQNTAFQVLQQGQELAQVCQLITRGVFLVRVEVFFAWRFSRYRTVVENVMLISFYADSLLVLFFFCCVILSIQIL